MVRRTLAISGANLKCPNIASKSVRTMPRTFRRYLYAAESYFIFETHLVCLDFARTRTGSAGISRARRLECVRRMCPKKALSVPAAAQICPKDESNNSAAARTGPKDVLSIQAAARTCPESASSIRPADGSCPESASNARESSPELEEIVHITSFSWLFIRAHDRKERFTPNSTDTPSTFRTHAVHHFNTHRLRIHTVPIRAPTAQTFAQSGHFSTTCRPQSRASGHYSDTRRPPLKYRSPRRSALATRVESFRLPQSSSDRSLTYQILVGPFDK